MRREKSLQTITIVVLAVAILAMSVGFAVYEQNLTINGTATFNKAVWDVHFDTSSFSETSEIKATEKSVGNNAITYSVTLPKPGSTYSFNVNAKNYGTIDAKLTGITLSGLTTEQQKYITYSVSYAGTVYNQTTTGLNVSLPAGESSTAAIIVTVNYVYPEEASDLPSSDQTVNLTAAFDYTDARN